MSKVLFVATVVKTHIMEFHVPYLKMFRDAGWETAVAARNDYEDPADCVIPYCDHYYDIPFERSPLKPGNIKAYRELKKVIDSGHYDIIHCHTPVGALLTRLAARKARKAGTRVLYTAHGFHFYKGAPLLNWLLYYPVEKLCARWTDTLITINKEDYDLACRKMRAGKVEYVPGVGIDVDRFANAAVDRAAKRREIGVPEDAFLLLSVGELNKNKNHQVVIKALAKCNNRKIHYAIAGQGNLDKDLLALARQLGISEQLHLLGYRNDVAELYKTADVDVFPSIREGLGLAALEGMAAGLPLIAADNRGTRDYARDGENGIVSPPTDADAFALAIQKLYEDPELYHAMASRAEKDAKAFEVEHINHRYLENIYHI